MITRPQKIILSLILILVILANGIFITGRILAQGSSNNYFNQHLRTEFIKSHALRSIFGLHDNGDDRFDYLGPKTKEIYVNVYVMQNEQISASVLQTLSDRIKENTGKAAAYRLENLNIPYAQTISDSDQDALFKKFAKQNLMPGEINLLVLSQAQSDPLLIGLTYRENGIMVFNESIKNFTAGSPKTFDAYQLSTILHEFGHQIGLDHNDMSGCLMTAHAETNHIAQSNPNNVITDFCDFEKQQIKSIFDLVNPQT